MVRKKDTEPGSATRPQEGSIASSPDAMYLPGTETVVVAAVTALKQLVGHALAKGADAAVDSALEHLRREGPVTHRVLASWLMDNSHCAAFEFYNATPHGAYLENMWVTEPAENIDFDLCKLPVTATLATETAQQNSTGWQFATTAETNRTPASDNSQTKDSVSYGFQWHSPKSYLPIYLPPFGTVSFAVKLKDDTVKTLSKTHVVGLTYSFTISDGRNTHTATGQIERVARVLLRSAGPIFTGGP